MDIYEACKTEAKRVVQLKVDVVLDSLDKKEADSLRKALLDDTIPSRTIERVLINNKIECGVWAINQWRRANKVKVFTSTTPRQSK